MLKYLKKFVHSLTSDPHKAGRMVVASVLIIGLCSLAINIAPQVAPQYFQSRLLDPLDKDTYIKAIAAAKKTKADREDLELRRECFVDRNSGYTQFLKNFEESFSGVLPGVGNLLLEHPSIVSNRKEKLIFEIMKKYAKLKFCVPEDQFKIIYLTDYTAALSKLKFFIQVRLFELEPEENPLNEENPAFIYTASEEYSFVEKDLKSTQIYVTDIVSRAIESAISLDETTENMLANVLLETANKQGADALKTLMKANEIGANLSKLQKEANMIDSTKIVYGIPINPSIEPPITKDFLKIKEASEKPRDVKRKISEEIRKDRDKRNVFSYGLLNLVSSDIVLSFEKNASKEAALYIAVKNRLDMLIPSPGENEPPILTLDLDDPYHMCHLEPKEEGDKCFNF